MQEDNGIFRNSVRDFRNFVTLRSRAGRSSAVLALIFLAFSIVVFILTNNPLLIYLCLFYSVCGVIAFFLGCIAKHLRRALWPDRFKVTSEMENYFEEPITHQEKDEAKPFSLEEKDWHKGHR